MNAKNLDPKRFAALGLAFVLILAFLLPAPALAAEQIYSYQINEPSSWCFVDYGTAYFLFSFNLPFMAWDDASFSATSTASSITVNLYSYADISQGVSAAVVSTSDTEIIGYVDPHSYTPGSTVGSITTPNVASWTYQLPSSSIGSLSSYATNGSWAGAPGLTVATVTFADTPPAEVEKPWWESFRDWFTDLGDSISSAFTAGIDKVVAAIGDLFDFERIWSEFSSWLDGFWADNDLESDFDNISNSVTSSVTALAPALAFVSRYLGGIADGMGDFLIVFTFPMFLGVVFFVLSKAPGVTRVEIGEGYDTTYYDSANGSRWTEHISGVKWKLRGK